MAMCGLVQASISAEPAYMRDYTTMVVSEAHRQGAHRAWARAGYTVGVINGTLSPARCPLP
jgi:hypothetical protein